MISKIFSALLVLAAANLTSVDAAAGDQRANAWRHDFFSAYMEAVRAGSSGGGAGAVFASLPNLGASDFTFTAWIKTKSDGVIFAKCSAKDIWARQEKALFVRGGKVTFDTGWVGAVASPQTVTDGKWRHVAFVSEAKSKRQSIYEDGVLAATGAMRIESDPKNTVFKIGHGAPNFPEAPFFRGMLDEVRIYGRALKAEEIKSDFAAPQPTPALESLGLLLRLPLDAAPGDKVPQATLEGAVKFSSGKYGAAMELDGKGCIVFYANPLDTFWGAMLKRFPNPQAQQEMAWEREDNLWNGARSVGELAAGFSAAAARYWDSLGKEARDLAASTKDEAGLEAVRQVYMKARAWRLQTSRMGVRNLGAFKSLIATIGKEFPQQYPANQYLDRLNEMERQRNEWAGATLDLNRMKAWERDLDLLRRESLVSANPHLGFDQVVFVKRYTYQSSHYYTDYIDGCRYYGGNVCVLSLKDGAVRDLAPSLKDGIFDRYDLSFDGKRVAFNWKASADKGFRIYEVGVDGSGLRQLTFDPPDEAERVRTYRNGYHHGTDDMHPCYLPDGGICFISTRCEYGILCDAPDVFTTTIMYRMDADGGNIEKISNSSVSEAAPSVMSDGRILYSRWEYVDKGAVSVKCLWAMNPDGSNSVEVFGNDVADPCTLLYGRTIPGAPNLILALATPHCCPVPGVGTVVRIDTRENIRTIKPLTYISSGVHIDKTGHTWLLHNRGGQWVQDREGPIYKDPFPLSDKLYLVSYNPDKLWNEKAAYGLALMDESGATEIFFGDSEISCWQPMPLRARPRPPVIPTSRKLETTGDGRAICMVADVYAGLEGVERGVIKYIRVNEQAPRPWSARRRWDGDVWDQQHPVITDKFHLGLKVQYGVVPVESDGSAHFYVPADRNVFLQVLDENYMEVQRERTYVMYRAGEIRSCMGCHERNIDAPRTNKMEAPAAFRRTPSVAGPQPGEKSGARPIHFPTDVQPILDAHCIRCHGAKEPKAKMDLTGTPTMLFSKSYESLIDRKRGLMTLIGENHPKWENVEYLPPYSLGSHKSKLITMLRKGHSDVKLKPEEMIRLTTWVDSNAQYYGSYWGRRNVKYQGMPDYRPVPTFDDAITTTLPRSLAQQGI